MPDLPDMDEMDEAAKALQVGREGTRFEAAKVRDCTLIVQATRQGLKSHSSRPCHSRTQRPSQTWRLGCQAEKAKRKAEDMTRMRLLPRYGQHFAERRLRSRPS